MLEDLQTENEQLRAELQAENTLNENLNEENKQLTEYKKQALEVPKLKEQIKSLANINESKQRENE